MHAILPCMHAIPVACMQFSLRACNSCFACMQSPPVGAGNLTRINLGTRRLTKRTCVRRGGALATCQAPTGRRHCIMQRVESLSAARARQLQTRPKPQTRTLIWSLVFGFWCLVSGLWSLIADLWSRVFLFSGLWPLLSGLWFLFSGLSSPWSLVCGFRCIVAGLVWSALV